MARRPLPTDRLPAFLELGITAMGARGDGIAQSPEGPVFVPLTVPGDRVLAEREAKRGGALWARARTIVAASPERVEPPCPVYGECGGCSLQHWRADAYRDWKRGLLVSAIARAGAAADLVAPSVSIPPGTRRRATFAFEAHKNRVVLGFNARASHRLVDLSSCLLLAPGLTAILAPLRAVLAAVAAGTRGDVTVTQTETGIDIVVETVAPLDLFGRESLARFAEETDLARLSWRRPGDPAEPVAERRQPMLRFGGASVVLPPGSFLQPSAEGERALAGLVFDAVGGAGRVADLFSGIGSFSLPLAQKADVLAVEGEKAAVAALSLAAGRARARLKAEMRDLARRPLAGAELKRFDAVVFDPPRAGAQAQAEALAQSGPGLVVAVSCNPATLARDAHALILGGYRLVRAVPVDQFPWSSHLEAVAVFQR